MSTADPKPAPSAVYRMGIDFGPLIIFFLTNSLAAKLPLPPVISHLGPVLIATAAFMVATLIAIAVSQWKFRHISPMLWLTSVLVLVFGGLTLYFHDQTFIQIKPTIVYSMLAAILAFGLYTGRPMLKIMLESAYPGLTDTGWRKLTINWIGFFAAMAIANEAVRASVTWDQWIAFKTWAVIPVTFLFALANIPMLMKHGLNAEEVDKTPLPPEG